MRKKIKNLIDIELKHKRLTCGKKNLTEILVKDKRQKNAILPSYKLENILFT